MCSLMDVGTAKTGTRTGAATLAAAGLDGRGEMVRPAPVAEEEATALRFCAGVVAEEEGIDGSLTAGTVSLSGEEGPGEGGSSNDEIDVNGLRRIYAISLLFLLDANHGTSDAAQSRWTHSASRSYVSSKSSHSCCCSPSLGSEPAALNLWITSNSSLRLVACSSLITLLREQTGW